MNIIDFFEVKKRSYQIYEKDFYSFKKYGESRRETKRYLSRSTFSVFKVTIEKINEGKTLEKGQYRINSNKNQIAFLRFKIEIIGPLKRNM